MLRDLHCGKAAGVDGIVAGMFEYSNIPLQKCLLDIYNSTGINPWNGMLKSGLQVWT